MFFQNMNNYQTISGDVAKKMISEDNAQLVDVRSPMEFMQGALPDAVNIPVQSIQSATQHLDPELPVILYCRSGARTRTAKMALENFGFNKVHDLGSYQNYFR